MSKTYPTDENGKVIPAVLHGHGGDGHRVVLHLGSVDDGPHCHGSPSPEMARYYPADADYNAPYIPPSEVWRYKAMGEQ